MDKRILIIAFIIFTNLVGVGLILPLLPFYAEKLGANPITIGFFVASYSLFAIVSAPILGALSDKYGRRPVLLFSLIGTVLGFILLGVADSIPLLFLARIADGASAGNVSTAQAYIADITSKQKRTAGMTIITIAVAAGSFLGPVIGGFFASYSIHAPAFVAVVFGLIGLLLTFFFLPETRDYSIVVAKKKLFFGIHDIVKTIKRPIVGTLIIIAFLIQLVFWMMLSTFALYGEHFFGLTTQQVAYLFAYDALIGILLQIIALEKLLHNVKEQFLFIIGTSILSGALFLLGLSGNIMLVILSLTLISLSGIANPVLTGLISKHTSDDEQGNSMGVLASIGSLAQLTAPIIATAIYAGINPRATYYIAGTIGLIAISLSIYALLRAKKTGLEAKYDSL